MGYIYGDRSRDEVNLITGEPVFIRDYWEAYRQAPAATINKLCRDIELALKKICYHIEDPEDDAAAAQLLEMGRSDKPATVLPVVEHRAIRFFEEKATLDRLNTLDLHTKSTLKTALNEYFGKVEAAGISDEALVRPRQGSIESLLILMLIAPFALAGYVVGGLFAVLHTELPGKRLKNRNFIPAYRPVWRAFLACFISSSCF